MIESNLIGQQIQGYTITKKLGSGGYGTVYLGTKEDLGVQYNTAIKHISMPDADAYDSVMQDYNYDKAATQAHFEKLVAGITTEINTLLSLSKKDNRYIVAYYDHNIQKNLDPLRFDITMRMEYLTPLNKAIRQKGITMGEVIKLGLNMCDALILCHGSDIMHRDIKEANIFVSDDGNYKLGDFGVAKTALETTQAGSMKGTASYMAPEIYLREPYDKTVDIYSLGIVLYKLLNNQRLPFMPDAPASFTADDKNNAESKRIRGETPPIPYNAKRRLGDIIVKACSVKTQRYTTAEELKNDLLEYSNSIDESERNSLIISPSAEGVESSDSGADVSINSSEMYTQTQGGTMTMGAAENVTMQNPAPPVQQNPYAPVQQAPVAPVQKPNGAGLNKKLIAIIASIAGVFVIGAIVTVILVLMNNRGEPTPTVDPETPPTIETTPTPTPPPAEEPDDDGQEEDDPDEPEPPPPPAAIPEGRSIVAAGTHTIAMKSDGTLLSTGWSGRPVYMTTRDIVHFSSLTNVEKIVGNGREIAVLHSNGDVSTTFDTNDINRFQGVKDIAIGSSHLIALKNDGSVIAAGYDSYGETSVSGWRNIVAVYAGRDWSVGLKEDGTVVATGRNDNGQCDVRNWEDVVSIITGYDYTLAITSGGRILGKGSTWWTGSSSITLNDFRNCTQLAGGSNHLVGLKSDGTVIAKGSNSQGQCDVYGWENIVMITAGDYMTVGLQSDGTIVYTGRHSDAQFDPNLMALSPTEILATDRYIAWVNGDKTIGITGAGFFFDLRYFPELNSVRNVSAIAAGIDFSAALISDGSVVVWGDNSAGQWAANDWSSITAIAAGANFLVGLQSDGKVITTYTETYNPIDMSSWEDIVEIAAGRDFALGLKSDGTVVAAGNNDRNQLNVRDWNNIIAIAAGRQFSVGLKADGTCVAVGNNTYNECDVYEWTDIVRLAASEYTTVGVRENGSVLIAGNVGYGNNKIDVSIWSNIVDVAVGSDHVVGLKSDGTLVSSGSNNFGQTDVSGWSLW